MNIKFIKLIFETGIADWLRGRKRCPLYWRGLEEERMWRAGFNYGKSYE